MANDVARWHGVVRSYLGTLPRGRAYQARLDILGTRQGTYPSGITLAVAGWWTQLQSDLARLNEFIADPNLGKP